MKCPVCDETFREIQKYGVTVDICPGCKGVWLDRGELEKILEMAAAGGPNVESRGEYARPAHVYDDSRSRHSRDYDEHGRGQGYPNKKRRGSWLGEIFESLGGD